MAIADELEARATQLDAADPLAHWRGQFHVPDAEIAYLDGNSLGMPPRRTLDRVQHVLAEEWGRDLILSWERRWLDLAAG